MNIALLDDHQLLLKGIGDSIAEKYPAANLTFFTNGHALLSDVLDKGNQFDLIITDISMPQLSGVEVCTKILEVLPTQAILVLSMILDRTTINHLLEIGVKGFVSKNASPEILQKAISQILLGETFVEAHVKKLISDEAEEKTLTKREIQLVQLISKGYKNKEIAEKVFLSQHTIDTHRKNILAKLEVKNTAELITWCAKHNII